MKLKSKKNGVKISDIMSFSMIADYFIVTLIGFGIIWFLVGVTYGTQTYSESNEGLAPLGLIMFFVGLFLGDEGDVEKDEGTNKRFILGVLCMLVCVVILFAISFYTSFTPLKDWITRYTVILYIIGYLFHFTSAKMFQ